MKKKQINRSFISVAGIVALLPFLFFSCGERPPPFFPIEAELNLASHFQGADLTVIQVTDHYFPLDYPEFQKDSRKYGSSYAEFLAFKHNIPLHVFDRRDKWHEFEDFLKTGRGGASVYYPCDKPYEESRLKDLIDDIKDQYGKTPTTLAYGCGNTEYANQLPNYILGARNSSAALYEHCQTAITWYGDGYGDSGNMDFSKTENLKNRPSGGRFYAEIQRFNTPIDEMFNYVIEQVERTTALNGFYTNFMHWQDYYANNKGDTIEGVKVMPYLFKAMAEGIGNHFTAKVDYNEAIEYLYAKEAIDTFYLSKNNESQYQINFKFKKRRPIDYSLIQIPVTIRVSNKTLSKLGVAGFRVKHSSGFGTTRDKDNVYLNIPIEFKKDSLSVSLEVILDQETIPFAFEKPILSRKKNTILSSTAAKFVLFRQKKGVPNHEIEIVEREYSYGKEFRIKDLEEGYYYFCGAINEQRESSLIKI